MSNIVNEVANEEDLVDVLQKAGFEVVEVYGGGVWSAAPVSEEPSIRLSNWQIKKTTTGNHFCGYSIGGREGRASTRIVTFDPETKKGITESGRVYQLVGEEGYDSNAEYVWSHFKAVNKLEELPA